jgi:hypothetical protein
MLLGDDGVSVGDRMHPDDTDRHRREHRWCAPDVIEMRMRDDEEVEPVDALAAKEADDVRIRITRIDEHRGTGRTQQERVPLADI